MAQSLLERLLASTSSRPRANGNAFISGDYTLQQGTNVTLSQLGSVITVDASLAALTRVRANASPYLSGDVTFAGSGVSQAGSVITIGLPSPYTATLATVDGKANSLLITAPTTLDDAPQKNILIKAPSTDDTNGGGGPDASSGGNVIIEGGNIDSSDGNSGGAAIVRGGKGTGGSQAGAAIVEGGEGAGSGGGVLIKGGECVGLPMFSGYAGSVSIDGGPVASGVDAVPGNVSITGGYHESDSGGEASLSGGSGGSGNTNGGGGYVYGGLANGSGNGGQARIEGGDAPNAGTGGPVFATGGDSGAGNGGALTLAGGASTGGTSKSGGAVAIDGGAASGTTGTGGYVQITGGAGSATGGQVGLAGGAGPVGGILYCVAGTSTGANAGGSASYSGGNGGSTGNGGPAALSGGPSGSGGTSKAGGSATVQGGTGSGTTGIGGDGVVAGGTGTGTGGDVRLTPGGGAGSTFGKTRVTRGAFEVGESNGTVKQISETCAPVTTTSTTATLVWSYALGTSENLWITVQATGDPGTAAATGAVTYTAQFRRTTGDNSGAAQQCGTTQDMSPNGGVAKNGFSVTISLNTNTVEVKVVAPNATSTLWAVAVGGLARTGPV